MLVNVAYYILLIVTQTNKSVRKTAATVGYIGNELFIILLYIIWFESFVQLSLVNFEKKFTSSEVYYIYQNTRKFIKREETIKKINYLLVSVIILVFGIEIA